MGSPVAQGSRFAGLALAAPGMVGLIAAAAMPERAAVASAPAGAQTAQLPLPPANGEVGFVLTNFAPGFIEGDEQCPGGLSPSVKENYLSTLPVAERERLTQKENQVEFEKKWKAYAIGPNGTNICTNAYSFDMTGRPAAKTLQGRVAYGLDLDGDATGKGGGDTCAHENFTGVDGTQGVDNQGYRALGCTINYRNVDGKQGDLIKGLDERLGNGEHSMVLLLRGVQSFANDDSVDVVLASTGDMPVLDLKRNFITGVSFTVTDNPRWRTETHGRIVGGVLVTDPADFRLSQRWGQGGQRGQRAEYDIRKGRMRIAFQPDGSIAGVMGGYQPITTLIQAHVLGGQGAATVAGLDCAAEYKALQAMADGLKDPATGKCTGASTANVIKGVPAFVFDRVSAKRAVAKR